MPTYLLTAAARSKLSSKERGNLRLKKPIITNTSADVNANTVDGQSAAAVSSSRGGGEGEGVGGGGGAISRSETAAVRC